jgi:hypothetical protein
VGVLFLDDDFFTIGVRGAYVGVRVRVVVAVTVDGVEDLISDLVETVAKRVVVTVFVVISHITLVLLGGVNGSPGRFLYANCFSGVAGVDGVNLASLRRVGLVDGREALLCVAGGLLEAWLGAEVGVTLLSCVTCDDGTGTFTELALGNVNLRGGVLGGRPGDGVEFSVVGGVLDVDVAAYVAVVGLLITVTGLELDLDAFSSLLGLLEASLLVDADLLAVLLLLLLLRAGLVRFLVDADVGEVGFATVLGPVVLVDGGCEGLAMLFVTFPSDGGRRELGFAFDLDFGYLRGDSVTPVRGREDTEGDRYAGVKVQVCESRDV